jgi:integrase
MRKPKAGRLKLTRRKGSPFWWVTGTIGGKRFRRSSETVDKDLADELRVKWERELQEQRVHGDRVVITFERAVSLYIDAKGERGGRFLLPLFDHFGVTPIHTITTADIMAFAANEYPRAANATINRQAIAPASAVINHALRLHSQPEIKYVRLKEPSGKTLWLRPDQAETLIQSCADYPSLQAYVIFMLGTGARRTESLTATLRDFHLSSRQVSLRETKTDTPRLVTYPSRTADALASLDLDDLTLTPFRNIKGQPPTWREGRTKLFDTAFYKRVSDCDLTGVTWHTLRHTWATWWYAVNTDLLRLMEQGGWERSETARRYAKMAPADLPAQLEAFGWHFGTTLTQSKREDRLNVES